MQSLFSFLLCSPIYHCHKSASAQWSTPYSLPTPCAPHVPLVLCNGSSKMIFVPRLASTVSTLLGRIREREREGGTYGALTNWKAPELKHIFITDSIEKCNSITHTLKFLNSNPNLFFNNKSKLFAVQISAPYPNQLKPKQTKVKQTKLNGTRAKQLTNSKSNIKESKDRTQSNKNCVKREEKRADRGQWIE